MPTEIKFDASAVTAKLHKAAFRGVVRGAELVRNEMIRLILTGPKTGRVYYKGHGAAHHRASAPGEAPASDTGRLINSLRTEYDQAKLSAKVIIGTQYGTWLEFGTQKIQPRPFARPALANMQKVIAEAIAEEIGRES